METSTSRFKTVLLTAVVTTLLLLTSFVYLDTIRGVELGFHNPLGIYLRRGMCTKHDMCTFIVSVGRSGSTALQDALNQLPNVYIRGENNNMLRMLYNIEQVSLQNSKKYPRLGDAVGPMSEKKEYEQHVLAGNKPAWYSLFQAGAASCASSSYFKHLYGYGGFHSYNVGFKEIRHADGLGMLLKLENQRPWIFPRYGAIVYKTYDSYLDWMRGLCQNSKIIFNMRREYDYTRGQGFYVGKGDILKRNIEWMHRYRKAHRSSCHLVYYEDMFDPKTNATVLKNVAAFLGIKNNDVPLGATFARVPRSR